eukprot:TRINITY_DN2_c1_g1_i1.p2 TRINITY_DN2_c1_g1~~TRINITY_DN2_c1_g1_i1.p2  ORF type:complete len:386 (+),score=148.47 TRINITY_DN2_c1_g1_i1:21-1178(+)
MGSASGKELIKNYRESVISGSPNFTTKENMKTALVALVVLGAILCAQAKVVDLTPDNFDQYVDGSKGAFVEFFAPWCGHCKRLEPEYEKVGAAFAKISDVVIAKVDADKHKDLASRFDVRGYPTLKWFPKGSTSPQEYNGGREADDIIKFVNEKAGTNAKTLTPPSDVVVLTPSNFDKIVNSDKDVFVEFYAPWCGHCKSLAPTWDKLGSVFKSEEGVVIAKVDADAHRDIASKHDVSGFPTLKWFSKTDKKGERYEGGRDLADLVKFVNDKAGTARTSEGRLAETVGLVENLGELVEKFVASPSADVLAEAEKVVAALAGSAAEHGANYVRTMKAVLKNGAEHVEKEIARLTRMLEGANVSAKKVDDFTLKINVLKAFQKAKTA